MTPAQAARLKQQAIQVWQACEAAQFVGGHAGPRPTDIIADALAVAAIDVMRGAADDGAVGRVLALADELDAGTRTRYMTGDDLRAAVGAPATAGGDGR